ncbi:MAG: hypothetical protein H6739_42355 [Alphaproteobacteria bacterium]|nr:hypothetical protein [Alphaproteobacteria bacterium]
MSLWMFAAVASAAQLEVGYHGHLLTHPGAAAAARWPLVEAPRLGLAATAGGGLWWHPQYEVVTFARGGLSGTLSGKGPAYGELTLRAGLARSTWAVPTYAVEGDAVERRRLAGDLALMGSVGLGGGRTTDFGAWFIRPELSVRAPHAIGVGLDLAVVAGLRFGGA